MPYEFDNTGYEYCGFEWMDDTVHPDINPADNGLENVSPAQISEAAHLVRYLRHNQCAETLGMANRVRININSMEDFQLEGVGPVERVVFSPDGDSEVEVLSTNFALEGEEDWGAIAEYAALTQNPGSMMFVVSDWRDPEGEGWQHYQCLHVLKKNEVTGKIQIAQWRNETYIDFLYHDSSAELGGGLEFRNQLIAELGNPEYLSSVVDESAEALELYINTDWLAFETVSIPLSDGLSDVFLVDDVEPEVCGFVKIDMCLPDSDETITTLVSNNMVSLSSPERFAKGVVKWMLSSAENPNDLLVINHGMESTSILHFASYPSGRVVVQSLSEVYDEYILEIIEEFEGDDDIDWDVFNEDGGDVDKEEDDESGDGDVGVDQESAAFWNKQLSFLDDDLKEI